jgi:hypothetical protein
MQQSINAETIAISCMNADMRQNMLDALTLSNVCAAPRSKLCPDCFNLHARRLMTFLVWKLWLYKHVEKGRSEIIP